MIVDHLTAQEIQTVMVMATVTLLLNHHSVLVVMTILPDQPVGIHVCMASLTTPISVFVKRLATMVQGVTSNVPVMGSVLEMEVVIVTL